MVMYRKYSCVCRWQTAPAGVATALASALAGRPNRLIAAYYSGKHAYHVSVMLVVKNQVNLKIIKTKNAYSKAFLVLLIAALHLIFFL
ncbi:hypothetical protein ACDX66_01640 [Peribacillus frigoritolerans]